MRNHALTKLLSGSLTGETKTLLLACVSPSAADQEHTVQTLRCVEGLMNYYKFMHAMSSLSRHV